MSKTGTHSIQVARIQMEVLTLLESLLGYEEAVNDLNSRLLDVNEVRIDFGPSQIAASKKSQKLYHKFARPLKMHEVILLILHTSNMGVQGRSLVEASWMEIIRKGIKIFKWFARENLEKNSC